MNVTVHEGSLLVDTRGYYHLAAQIRNVAGNRWNSKLNGFLIPPSLISVWELSRIHHLSWSDDAKKLAYEVREDAQIRWDAQMTRTGDTRLTPLQLGGVDWLRTGSGLLADEMGSGKTVQACVAMTQDKVRKVLIVCPPTVTKVWVDHIIDWSNLTPIVVQGTKPQRAKKLRQLKDNDRYAVIIPWTSLRLHSKLAPYGATKRTDEECEPKELNEFEWDLVVADEAHRAKNPRAKQTRALWSLDAKKRWALTGTPIANTAADLWSLLRWIEPEVWTSRERFINMWCDKAYNPFGAPTILGFLPERVRLFRQLTGHQILRRTKAEIMERSIIKHHSTIYATLPPKHRRMYEELKQDWLTELELQDGNTGNLMVGNFLTLTVRLTQLASAPLTMEADDKPVMRGPSPKVVALAELLADTAPQPVVVYSSSLQLADLAEKRLKRDKISYVRATGKESAEERQESVTKFQDGEARVFLATTGAAGEGITLTKSSLLVHLSLPWSMVQVSQAEDRIHRWGQESDQVQIVDILSDDTIDERIADVLRHKKAMLHQLKPIDLKH